MFRLEPLVLKEVVDKRAVVAVHGTAEEADDGKEVYTDLGLGPSCRRILDHGFREGHIAAGDLGRNLPLCGNRQQVIYVR